MAESFVATLKTELLVHRRRFPDREVAKSAIFEYLEGFYNRRRLHSALSYRSPADYEEATMEGVAEAWTLPVHETEAIPYQDRVKKRWSPSFALSLSRTPVGRALTLQASPLLHSSRLRAARMRAMPCTASSPLRYTALSRQEPCPCRARKRRSRALAS